MFTRKLIPLVISVSLAAIVFGQSVSDLMVQGQTAYEKKEYAKSAQLYMKAYKADPKQRLALYNAACSFALDGKAGEALAALEELANTGFNNIDHLKNDTDFASIHSDARWAAVVAKVEENAKKNPLKPRWTRPYSILPAPTAEGDLRSKLGPDGSAV